MYKFAFILVFIYLFGKNFSLETSEFTSLSSQRSNQFAFIDDDSVSATSSSKGLLSCTKCRVVAAAVLLFYSKERSTDKLKEYVINICVNDFGYNRDTCTGLADLNLPTLEYIIKNRPDITPKEICSKIYQPACAKKRTKYSKDSFGFDINTYDDIPKKYSRTPKSSQKPPLKIIHLTDFHYEPEYMAGANAKCGHTSCCRKDSGYAESVENAAGIWGDYRECDGPEIAIDAVFNHISKEQKNIDAVYYTGDTVSHNLWGTSVDQVKHSIDFLSKKLEKLSQDYGATISSIIGNHDIHPSNLFAPSDIQNELNATWLYESVLESWENWIPKESQALFAKHGYFSKKIFPKLRLIGLNSNVAYVHNWWVMYNTTSLFQPQLQWLTNELLDAEKNEEFVHILSHIPPGSRHGDVIWQKLMRRIYSRFSHIIKAQFVGHTHHDEMHLIYGDEADDNILGVAFNGGGLTPWTNVNPGYRVFYVDPDNYDILDYEVWVYNLTEANLFSNVTTQPDWYKLYSFKHDYGLESLSLKNLHDLAGRMMQNETLLQQYQRFRSKDTDLFKLNNCDFKCRRDKICEIVSDVYKDNRQCYRIADKFQTVI